MTEKSYLERIMLAPAHVYGDPEEVLQDQKLSQQEKKQALEQWKYDAILMETASSENMNGGEQAKLGRIMKCIDQLG